MTKEPLTKGEKRNLVLKVMNLLNDESDDDVCEVLLVGLTHACNVSDNPHVNLTLAIEYLNDVRRNQFGEGK